MGEVGGGSWEGRGDLVHWWWGGGVMLEEMVVLGGEGVKVAVW